jgi:hypothetical protein
MEEDRGLTHDALCNKSITASLCDCSHLSEPLVDALY